VAEAHRYECGTQKWNPKRTSISSRERCRENNGDVCAHKAQSSEKHEHSRAIEMSAEVTSGGRSSKSTPLPSSLTLTRVKEVWERLADGVGMGRLRLAGSAEVGLYGSAEVLLPEGRGEDGLVDGPGECPRMGVET
jgi:hypothetical protein